MDRRTVRSHAHFCPGRYPAAILAFLLAELIIYVRSSPGEVIWAVNCGGEAHVDVNGVAYQRDPLQRTGVASDFGRSLLIQRVPPADQILYQTERYHTTNFAYDVPVSRDGDYVLVLKFCEVWFTQPNQKVFDVLLNGQITVIEGLDIFSKVGRGVAHDEIVPFSIRSGQLHVGAEVTAINGKLNIEFVKLDMDNPKINAIYVMRGTPDDAPRLPPIYGGVDLPPSSSPSSQSGTLTSAKDQQPGHDEEDDDADDDEARLRRQRRHHAPLEPKVQDPYATDDTGSMLLPVVVAVGAFIPLLFCLCRL
jgi:hypothetical protein